jgi:hypothetical protein
MLARLERLLPGHHQANLIEAQSLPERLRGDEMAVVNGIV